MSHWGFELLGVNQRLLGADDTGPALLPQPGTSSHRRDKAAEGVVALDRRVQAGREHTLLQI